MPAELLELTEKLANLQALYIAGIKANKPPEEIDKLRHSIIQLQDEVLDRKAMLKGEEKNSHA